MSRSINVGGRVRDLARRFTKPARRRVRPLRASRCRAAPRFGFAAASRSACLCEGAIGDWSGVYLANNLGAAPSLAAAGYGAFSAAMIAGRFGGDWFVARFGQARTVRYGGLVSALGIAFALIAPDPVVSALGFGIVGIGVSNVVPIVFSAAARLGSSPASGVAMAASAGYSGLLLGPVLIGALATLFGLKASLWLLAPCAGIIALTGSSIGRGETGKA